MDEIRAKALEEAVLFHMNTGADVALVTATAEKFYEFLRAHGNKFGSMPKPA